MENLPTDLVTAILDYIPPYPYDQSEAAFSYHKTLQEHFFAKVKSESASVEEKQSADNASYDYCIKLWSNKCSECEHYHHLVFFRNGEKTCWKCMAEKTGEVPVLVISNEIDGCVCCRTLESPYRWRWQEKTYEQ